jgi:hypothetical protein
METTSGLSCPSAGRGQQWTVGCCRMLRKGHGSVIYIRGNRKRDASTHFQRSYKIIVFATSEKVRVGYLAEYKLMETGLGEAVQEQ